jgi:murein DD-endopeptidase MepM/ murein hydrolase activator NlpD
MHMSTNRDHRPTDRRRGALAVAVFACLALALTMAALAPAQDLQGRLDEKQGQLDSAKDQEGVLSTTIEKYSGEIDQLLGEVATLRNREAEVQEELDQTEARLAGAREHLNILRERFARSVHILRKRLVSIYKSDEPDALTVILQSDGFDDLLERYQYLTSIEEQDASLVNRVRTLRDDTRNTVEEVRTARDEIAARKAELERTRVQLEARESDLSAARASKQDALQDTRTNIERLEGDIGDIQDDIAAQLQAAQAATPTLPSGPVPGGVSSAGFIWPVSGPVTSPFGWRWGRMHEGIDIAVPSGTPIHAVADGRVALAAPTSGYGNYTCVDHGGGLASCYAHQSSFAASVGQAVKQGQVIGYSGCTGSCFGDHLHFEVRVNGSAVDPMGYL